MKIRTSRSICNRFAVTTIYSIYIYVYREIHTGVELKRKITELETKSTEDLLQHTQKLISFKLYS